MELNCSSTSEPGVSVVIPCRNEIRHIEACLRSVLEQKEVPGGIEVVVADGMSDDGTRVLLEQLSHQHPQLRVIDNPRGIVSAGLNSAIKAARGEIIVRMDAHTEYAPDYVEQCVETLRRTGADNVGGPARTRSSTYVERAIAAAYHSPFAAGGARFHIVDYEGSVDTVTYGCWRKSAFERFGYFDEELVRNQDDEHNLRLTRGGGRIWQSPEIKSWYRPRGTLGDLFRQYLQYGYWKVRVIQKHKLPASWRHLIPGGFVLTIAVLLVLWAFGVLSSRWWHSSHLLATASGIGLSVIVTVYAAANLVASLVTARTNDWALFPVLPLVFGCYHMGYGYGFLRGLWDFLIRRRGPDKAFGQLTR
jgi:glycosyltransferase involved in cell wall biosynthesis